LSREESLLKQLVKQEVERLVPPEMTILLDDIARGIKQILAHLRETTPEGVDVKLPELTVTDVELLDFLREYPYRPLRSIDLFNKGPDTAYYRVNEEGKEIPIENREYIRVERPKATIRFMTLRVDKGKSATIKPIGHY